VISIHDLHLLFNTLESRHDDFISAKFRFRSYNMQSIRSIKRAVFLVIVLALAFGVVAGVGAHEGDEAITGARPLTLEFSTELTAEPSFDFLEDGRIVFNAKTAGALSSGLEGTLSQNVTQVVYTPEPPAEPITTSFRIETADGWIEGYVSGYFYREPGQDASVQQHGQVLSVSAAYADWFLADVFFDSIVLINENTPLGDTGTMTLFPAPHISG
jgi:hypothetical protein